MPSHRRTFRSAFRRGVDAAVTARSAAVTAASPAAVTAARRRRCSGAVVSDGASTVLYSGAHGGCGDRSAELIGCGDGASE